MLKKRNKIKKKKNTPLCGLLELQINWPFNSDRGDGKEISVGSL